MRLRLHFAQIDSEIKIKVKKNYKHCAIYRCTGTDRCIPGNWHCDQYEDCPDASDERDCVHDETDDYAPSQTAQTNGRTFPFVHDQKPNNTSRYFFARTSNIILADNFVLTICDLIVLFEEENKEQYCNY